MSKEEAVKAIYDQDDALQFYRIVMGDGGDDVHYGHYTESTTSTRDATANTVLNFFQFAKKNGVVFGPSTRVLDSGSGTTGTSIKLSAETESSFVCLNLCPKQNAIAESRLKELGLQDRISVVTGSFDKLSDDWTESFDVIISIDAFLHSRNKKQLIQEAFRALRPGGYMVFSDVMASDKASPEELIPFKNRLKVDDMYTSSRYEKDLKDAGFEVLDTLNWTSHLVTNYKMMLRNVAQNRDSLNQCTDEFVNHHVSCLHSTIEVLSTKEAQTWEGFACRKADLLQPIPCSVAQ